MSRSPLPTNKFIEKYKENKTYVSCIRDNIKFFEPTS